MSGVGVELRMKILRDSASTSILAPLRAHGWSGDIAAEEQDGEYLLIRATRGTHTHTVALLYSSWVANRVYKSLVPLVERIFVNGTLYKVDEYARDISIPVTHLSDFGAALVEWNRLVEPPAAGTVGRPASKKALPARHLSSENPIEQIWSRLNHLRSVQLAEKLIARRALRIGHLLSDDAKRRKAEGLAFTLRNGSDYFGGLQRESLGRRVLSQYYGALALAFAEMLASPTGPTDLDELEEVTRFGHGLYTLDADTNDFGDLAVGVLDRGFFPRWVSFLGHNTKRFPAKKPKELDSSLGDLQLTVRELLGRIPELADLYLDVFEGPQFWVVPLFDGDANPSFSAYPPVKTRPSSTYIRLLDPSGRMNEDLIGRLPGQFREARLVSSDADGAQALVRLDHEGYEYWHEALPVHHSPFLNRSALIVPLFGTISDFRVTALVLLYALSIYVRYRPSVWRRVQDGDWDQHREIIRAFLDVTERVLPEEFLGAINGEQVYAKQPGTLW